MTSGNTKGQNVDLDLSNYRQLFLEEACSYLALLHRNLSKLRDAPCDVRAQREGRRAAHTLKGMAATMHYEELAALGKRMENQLQHEEPLTPGQIDELLADCALYDKGLKQLDGGE
jgi:two-component system chemotaxis sensor kinase CheA